MFTTKEEPSSKLSESQNTAFWLVAFENRLNFMNYYKARKNDFKICLIYVCTILSQFIRFWFKWFGELFISFLYLAKVVVAAKQFDLANFNLAWFGTTLPFFKYVRHVNLNSFFTKLFCSLLLCLKAAVRACQTQQLLYNLWLKNVSTNGTILKFFDRCCVKRPW